MVVRRGRWGEVLSADDNHCRGRRGPRWRILASDSASHGSVVSCPRAARVVEDEFSNEIPCEDRVDLRHVEAGVILCQLYVLRFSRF